MEYNPVVIIDQRIADDGSIERLRLDAEGDAIVLSDHAGARYNVRLEAVVAIMRRYGRPLDDDVALPAAGLALAPNIELRALRHRAPVDAAARDYAVLCVAQRPPIAVLSTVFAGALYHLVKRQ